MQCYPVLNFLRFLTYSRNTQKYVLILIYKDTSYWHRVRRWRFRPTLTTLIRETGKLEVEFDPGSTVDQPVESPVPSPTLLIVTGMTAHEYCHLNCRPLEGVPRGLRRPCTGNHRTGHRIRLTTNYRLYLHREWRFIESHRSLTGEIQKGRHRHQKGREKRTIVMVKRSLLERVWDVLRSLKLLGVMN